MDRNQKKGSTSSEVPRMSSVSRSHPLVSILDDTANMDWGTWVFECPTCPGRKRIPYTVLAQHQNWHARVHLLYHLRTRMRDAWGTLSFGPSEPGCLVRIDYKEDAKVLGTEVTQEEMGTFLKSLSKEPFVKLKFLDGLKYTFGNKFVGRKSQGEFIYLNLNDDKDDIVDGIPEEENYFQLDCKEESFWISTTTVEGFSPTTTEVYINGLPLRTDDQNQSNSRSNHSPVPFPCEQNIVFGDIITVSLGSDAAKEPRFYDFIFKPVAEIDSNGVLNDWEETEPNEKAFDNPLVVQNLLHFLPTKCVKGLRCLSHLWNTEGLKLLRNRVVVTIFEHITDDDSTDNLMQISHYIHSQLNDLKFPNWRIELPEDRDRELPSDIDEERDTAIFLFRKRRQEMKDVGQRLTMRHKKILDDFAWLVDPLLQTHNVKTLELCGRIVSESGLQFLEALLCGGVFKNTLTTLNLELRFYHQPESLPEFKGEMLALKTLSLSLIEKKMVAASSIKKLIQTILPATHNIDALNLHTQSNSSHHGNRMTMRFPRWVFSHIQTVGSDGFRKLTKITMNSTGDSLMQPLNSLRQGSLKILELRGLTPGGRPRLPDFSTPYRSQGISQLLFVLERHADSLEEVTLQFDLNTKLPVHINFPTRMRKLTSLSLLFGLYGRHATSFTFGSSGLRRQSRINYREHFPSLSKLTLWPGNLPSPGTEHSRSLRRRGPAVWNNFLPFLTPFLQPTDADENGRITPVPSIQILIVPFLLKGRYNHILDNLELTFPNVDFPPELAAARQEDVSNSDFEFSTDEERHWSDDDYGTDEWEGGGGNDHADEEEEDDADEEEDNGESSSSDS